MMDQHNGESATEVKCNRGDSAAVLIVGAGPTGLLLAAELELRGVRCHLIDARPAPLHWDRATVIHPRSLQIFESMGLADKFLEAGCRQRQIKIHSDGEALGTLDLASCGSIYGFNVGLSEEVTESILTECLHSRGGEVNRSSRLVNLTPQPGGMLAEIECHGARYAMNVQWVVGCDGIHSTTREQFGIEMEGHAIARPWAVVDVTLTDWVETYEATFVYLDTPPVVLTAIPDKRWRVYLRPKSEDSDLLADAMETLRNYAPNSSFADVQNPTRFHCHTKIANTFRLGRVFLAGDAAHICSPAEGHGMNRGLQDAFNLAWKLALVCEGADFSLLDSYDLERRPPAELVAQSGDNTEHNLLMTDPAERAARNQAICAMFADAKMRHHEIVAETELNVEYSGSPIVLGDRCDGIAAGYRIQDTIVVQPAGRPRCRLVELTQRPGHTLLLIAGDAAGGTELVHLESALNEFIAKGKLFEAVFTLATEPDLSASIGRLGRDEADLLGVRGISLLAARPDGYVGLRADKDHIQALERYRGLILEGARKAASVA